MNPTLAILTIGVVAISEIMPLLAGQVPEDQIKHISLMGALTREEALAEYGPEPGHETMLTLLSNREIISVSRQKTEQALQHAIEMLDNQGYDVILLMSTFRFTKLQARNSILLEPQRIIPPLVASIVDGHQVGVIVPVPELLPIQEEKWAVLKNPPLYALANPISGTDQDLLDAGSMLIEQGVDVLMLDCLGYHQKHRDLLQQELDVPVLLSNVLVAHLASELLV
ncbi:AroM family protein [Atlantibacter sp.]|uniref:AroM family protein n=1 Tax=Atlantibacter sp. TaxID=1903473 RepID=UPI0013EF6DC2|nr:AroM family protein [Atlantibacter sp.]